jgi:hypothetical protein
MIITFLSRRGLVEAPSLLRLATAPRLCASRSTEAATADQNATILSEPPPRLHPFSRNERLPVEKEMTLNQLLRTSCFSR